MDEKPIEIVNRQSYPEYFGRAVESANFRIVSRRLPIAFRSMEHIRHLTAPSFKAWKRRRIPHSATYLSATWLILSMQSEERKKLQLKPHQDMHLNWILTDSRGSRWKVHAGDCGTESYYAILWVPWNWVYGISYHISPDRQRRFVVSLLVKLNILERQ